MGLAIRNEVHAMGRAQPWHADLAACQGEVYGYLGIHFDGLSIEDVGLVPPLADGVECTRDEHRVTTDGFQILNRTILADDSLEYDRTRDARLLGERRIRRRTLRMRSPLTTPEET